MKKTLLVLVFALGALSPACSSEDDRPAYCQGCYAQGGFGAGGGGFDAGVGGAGGSALASSGGAPQCQGGRGAPMEFISVSDGVGYCIDTREVTVTEWNVFLKYAPEFPIQAAPCEENIGWPNFGGQDSLMAVTWIDWCDALAFCAWANKRLCGRIPDGAAITVEQDAVNPTVDEWTFACSNGGMTVYPYGDMFSETICNTHMIGNQIEEVESNPDCHGIGSPYASLFDMSGNLAEWTNACEPDPAILVEDQYCYLRGGDWINPNREEAGKCRNIDKKQRVEKSQNLWGIRCCKDADLSATSDAGADSATADAAAD